MSSDASDTTDSSMVRRSQASYDKKRVFKLGGPNTYGFRFINRSFSLENCLIDGSLNVIVDIQIYTENKEIWTPLKRNIPFELLNMLQTGKNSDVTFIVGNKTFTAHRTILASGAPNLSEILNDNDMSNNGNEEVIIKDIDPEIFCYLLHFIYTDNLDSTNEKFKSNAHRILEVANKFGCERLKILAEASIVKYDITENNVLELLLFADAMCCPLKEATTKYCVTYSSTIMSTDEWKELKRSHV